MIYCLNTKCGWKCEPQFKSTILKPCPYCGGGKLYTEDEVKAKLIELKKNKERLAEIMNPYHTTTIEITIE